MKRLLLLCSALLVFSSCKKVATTTPQVRPLVEAVYASGKVLPADNHQVYAQADGVIVEQFVTEGATVRRNQPLFRLENSSQQARLAGAGVALQQAEANLRGDSPVLGELQTQLASLRARVADDSTNYARYQNLWRQNATARVNLDRAALAYQTSRNDLAAAQERLRRTRNQLRVDLANARTAARVNRTDAGNTLVRSDVDGTVFDVFRKQGEAIRRGEPLASLGKGGFYLQLWIDEQDVARVSPGQDVLVKMDLYKDRTFKARVTKLYPTLNPENQSVRADAEFVETPPRLVANAFAEANIVISRKAAALTVPKSLVLNDSVLVQTADGKPQKVAIRKGIETTDYVEVLGGLTKDATLIQP
jgi:multidrug efflux pump subunit AcrA (membrane-fusion protein)